MRIEIMMTATGHNLSSDSDESTLRENDILPAFLNTSL